MHALLRDWLGLSPAYVDDELLELILDLRRTTILLSAVSLRL